MGEQLPSEAEIVWERILFRVSLGHISFYFVYLAFSLATL